MDNAIKINIQDHKGNHHHLSFQSEREFRILYFDSEGTPQILGKIPLKMLRGPLRQWSRSWAVSQNLYDFEVALRKKDVNFDPEDALSSLDTRWDEQYSEDHNRREDHVASEMVKEIVRALLLRLRDLGGKIKTIWQFQKDTGSSSDEETILEWIFRGR